MKKQNPELTIPVYPIYSYISFKYHTLDYNISRVIYCTLSAADVTSPEGSGGLCTSLELLILAVTPSCQYSFRGCFTALCRPSLSRTRWASSNDDRLGSTRDTWRILACVPYKYNKIQLIPNTLTVRYKYGVGYTIVITTLSSQVSLRSRPTRP